mmetsp:Transcript_12235/g.37330  ORF Transcript_12235/g.37330 Transcript_12235/m.37330 type:complete len:335 (+) Transcript_12235:33-1037(+)
MEFHVSAGAYDGAVCGFDVAGLKSKTLQLRYGYSAHTSVVRDMCMSGSLMLSASADDTLRIYDVRKRSETGCLVQHEGPVNCCTLYENKFALSGGEAGEMCVWRCRDWELLRQVKAHKGGVLDVKFHPSGTVAASIGRDTKLRLWDLTKGQVAFTASLKNDVRKLAWLRGGEKFAVAHGKSVSVYDSEAGKVIKEYEQPSSILSLASIGRNRMAVGGEGGMLQVCDLRASRGQLELAGHSTRVKSIAVVNKIAFSADTDGWIMGWVVGKDSEPLCKVRIHKRITALGAGAWPVEQDDDTGAGQSRKTKAENGTEDKISASVPATKKKRRRKAET